MAERNRGLHPDVARAIAIVSSAKEEAKKQIPGAGPEVESARTGLASLIIEQNAQRTTNGNKSESEAKVDK